MKLFLASCLCLASAGQLLSAQDNYQPPPQSPNSGQYQPNQQPQNPQQNYPQGQQNNQQDYSQPPPNYPQSQQNYPQPGYQQQGQAYPQQNQGYPQQPYSNQGQYGPPNGPAPQYAQQSQEALPPLDQLLAPVALYPDPLLGLVLAAATEPDQVQAAAGFLNSGADPNAVNAQPWTDAVKGIAHYPDVTRWMADNLQWTQQVGAAFAQQPQGVMDAVQDLRRRALSAGTLRSAGQMQVTQDNGSIRIMPAQPDVIYVPRYNPYAVYFPGDPDANFAWGEAYPAGPWLTFYPDWHRRALYFGNWYHRGDWSGWGGEHFRIGGFGISIGGREREWHVPEASPVWHFGLDLRDPDRFYHPGFIQGAPGRDWGHEGGFRGYDRFRGDRDQGRYHGRPEDYRHDEGRHDEGRRPDDHREDGH
jgi:hypothetical protein